RHRTRAACPASASRVGYPATWAVSADLAPPPGGRQGLDLVAAESQAPQAVRAWPADLAGWGALGGEGSAGGSAGGEGLRAEARLPEWAALPDEWAEEAVMTAPAASSAVSRRPRRRVTAT